MIKLLHPGMFTSIQDPGRRGYRNMGVPIGGAMDLNAAKIANFLVGNKATAPLLEFTSPGPELEFDAPLRIVLTGADLRAKLNGRDLPLYEPVDVQAGSNLKFGSSGRMMWGYMAVTGTLEQKMILGSHSQTYGVTPKYRLEVGDSLPFKPIKANSVGIQEFGSGVPDYESVLLEVSKGPDFGRLSDHTQSLLLENEFKLSSECNRMAYVIEGNFKPGADDIITAPVQPGTVQMTGSGKIIILMRDAQTTGGYARIFQLTEDSMNILSQKRPGYSVLFELSDSTMH